MKDELKRVGWYLAFYVGVVLTSENSDVWWKAALGFALLAGSIWSASKRLWPVVPQAKISCPRCGQSPYWCEKSGVCK